MYIGPKQNTPTTEPVKETKPTVDSDTDYNSGSSRSSSLETTPSKQEKVAINTKASVGRSRDRTSESYVTKSVTIERPTKSSLTASYDSQRDKRIDMTTSLQSATLGRRTTADVTTRSVADRKRATSTKLASPDITSLNPATIQSLEKLERIKQRDHHRRPRTPEPTSPKVTQTKLMMSPDRLSRRKSLGNHPIGPIIGQLTCRATAVPEEPEISDDKIENSSSTKTIEKSISEKTSDDISVATKDTDAVKKVREDNESTTTVTTTVTAGPEKLVSDSKNELLNKAAIKVTTDEDCVTNKDATKTTENIVTKVENTPQKKELSRTMSTPPKSSSDSRRSKYKSSTDNIFIQRTPVESVWGSFRTENATSSFRTKTKSDDSWRVKTPTSASPLPSRRKYDTSPNTSRSNTPTSPPIRKPEDAKRENSFGSRSTTPTSPIIKDIEKPLREGRSSPRQTTTVSRVTSPLPKTEILVSSVAKENQTAKSPIPPRSTDGSDRTRLTTSPGRDYRRPKSRDSEAVRARKIEQRNTPVLTPEALETLDNMLKCGITEDILETCIEEEEEIAVKKTNLKFEPTKKVSIDTEPSVIVEAPTPSTETRPPLGVQRQSLSDRSKSLGTLGNERNSSPVCPEEGDFPSDAFSSSLNSRLPLGGFSRRSFSGMSTSLSMTDLSQIGKKKSKARRMSRSNSKRMIGNSAIDSYVADTRTSPSHRTPGSLTVSNLQSSSSRTLPARVLSGAGIESKEKKTEKRFRLFKK